MIPNRKEHSIAVVYLIRCNINDMIYVGSSVNFYRRFIRYRRSSKENSRIRIHRALKEFGFDNFTFEILERIPDESQLVKREQAWMDALTPFGDVGFNTNRVAGSSLGMRHTDETKKKLSKLHMGKKLSAEHIEQLRIRMTESNHMSGKTHPKSICEKMKKPVIVYSLDGIELCEWPSITESSKDLEIPLASISSCCTGKAKTCHGWVFKLKHPEIPQGRMIKMTETNACTN